MLVGVLFVVLPCALSGCAGRAFAAAGAFFAGGMIYAICIRGYESVRAGTCTAWFLTIPDNRLITGLVNRFPQDRP